MNCDPIARWYRPAEYLCFGKSLEHCRLAFLSEARTARRALLCGGGDGRFLAALLRANSSVEVEFLDLSRQMIEVAQRRITRMGKEFQARVVFHQADARIFAPLRSGFDLVATHFFLDCLSERAAAGVIERIASLAAPRAQWIVSEFHQPQESPARLWTGAVIRGLYAAFRATTGLRATRIPPFESALTNAGFQPQQRHESLGGLLVAGLWQRSI